MNNCRAKRVFTSLQLNWKLGAFFKLADLVFTISGVIGFVGFFASLLGFFASLFDFFAKRKNHLTN